jgi:hypothetical protein
MNTTNNAGLFLICELKHLNVDVSQYQYQVFGFDINHELPPVYRLRYGNPDVEIVIKSRTSSETFRFSNFVTYVKKCAIDTNINNKIKSDCKKFMKSFKRFF